MIRNSDVTLITDATSAPMAGETFTVTGGSGDSAPRSEYR